MTDTLVTRIEECCDLPNLFSFLKQYFENLWKILMTCTILINIYDMTKTEQNALVIAILMHGYMIYLHVESFQGCPREICI